MNSFHARITPQQASEIWQAADLAGFMDESVKSVIVHDLTRLRARISALQAAFPSQTLHAIAIKANPLVEVLRVAVEMGAGLEAASMEEVYVALEAGCRPERIVFDSPAKTTAEITESLQRGIHLNADNFSELSRIADARKSLSSSSTVGLRVNPEVVAGTISQTSVGSVGSKFGVSLSIGRKRIIDSFRQFDWLVGLHVHVGSQGCSLELLCEAVGRIQALRSEIISLARRNVSIVDIGGGLPAAYTEQANPPSPQQYARQMAVEIPQLWQPDVQLMTEFGRAVQAGCGIALSRVEYVREDAGKKMAVIHLGADFLLRPVYRSQDWTHEFIVIDACGQVKVGDVEPVSLAGPLCFAGDILARQILLPRINPGDWIAIRDCGAYTLSMWSRHCSRGIPAVLGYDADASQVRLLREAESPTDMARFWALDHQRNND